MMETEEAECPRHGAFLKRTIVLGERPVLWLRECPECEREEREERERQEALTLSALRAETADRLAKSGADSLLRSAGWPSESPAGFKGFIADSPPLTAIRAALLAWCHSRADPASPPVNPVLFGPPGTGKTRLALACALGLVKRGRSVGYLKAARLSADLRSALDFRAPYGALNRLLDDLVALDLLVLDEASAVLFSKSELPHVADLFDRRHSLSKVVLVVSNAPPAELRHIYGPPTADRWLSRALLLDFAGLKSRRS